MDNIVLLNLAFHCDSNRVASVIEFLVCLFSVGLFSVCYKFSNSLQHNIRPPSRNCDQCATEFAVGMNLKRHDTLRRTVINVMMIFL